MIKFFKKAKPVSSIPEPEFVPSKECLQEQVKLYLESNKNNEETTLENISLVGKDHIKILDSIFPLKFLLISIRNSCEILYYSSEDKNYHVTTYLFYKDTSPRINYTTTVLTFSLCSDLNKEYSLTFSNCEIGKKAYDKVVDIISKSS